MLVAHYIAVHFGAEPQAAEKNWFGTAADVAVFDGRDAALFVVVDWREYVERGHGV